MVDYNTICGEPIPMDPQAQTELERLKREVAELRKALNDKQQLEQPSLPALRDNFEFVVDCARFAEGLVSEAAMRRKYHLEEETWTALGNDEQLIERIELEKVRRVRDGSFKREKAQQLIVKGPEILDGIMSDTKANAKHRIDAAKVLDTFAANGPRAEQEADHVLITINLGGDEKLVFDKAVKPNDPIDLDPINDPLPGFLAIAAKKDDRGGEPV